jgi:hypothetical protein
MEASTFSQQVSSTSASDPGPANRGHNGGALSAISEAVLEGQITREEEEYLTQEKYEVSMMQYQALSTLRVA